MTPLSIIPRPVTIQYRRLPNRLRHFRGILRAESKDWLVIEHQLRMRSPKRIFGRTAVSDRYLALWFIRRGKWYDIGKFYNKKGKFAGYYCDIIRPVAKLLSNASKTSIITDLFLDLWIGADGRRLVLDEDELRIALAKHIISTRLARRARIELLTLLQAAQAGHFPPRYVRRFQPVMVAR